MMTLPSRRVLAFVIVGAIGFAVQMAAFAALTRVAGWPVAIATAASVFAAVVHNFAWHRHWTWRDRTNDRRQWPAALAEFALTTGSISIAGNVAFMALYTIALHIDPFIAVALSVASVTVFNFLACDRVVFRVRR